jgi:hypothetical protein
MGKSRHVCRKWIEDNQIASVVGRTNNQAPALEPALEQKCVHMIFEGASTRREANSCSCR